MLAVIALLGLAVVMVHSAGMTAGSQGAQLAAALTGRPMIYALFALAAMWLASVVNIRQVMVLRRWWNPAYLLFITALVLVGLTLIPGVGRTVNGATRWLYLGQRTYPLGYRSPGKIMRL